MPLFEIDRVTLAPLDAEILYGRSIRQPKIGLQPDSYALDVAGWVLGKKCPAVAIEVRGKGVEGRRWPTNLRRGDVSAEFPDVTGSGACGFQASISLLPYPPEFDLTVRAVLQDETYVPIATIRGRRSPLHTSFQPMLQPLPITSLGRSGSTWLTTLLGQHPQIYAYQPFQHEVRVSTYWMEVFRTLSEPVSYLQAIRPEINDDYWWTGRKRITPLPLFFNDPVMQRFLACDAIEEMAAFCLQQIEAFYVQAVGAEAKSTAKFFTEKNSGVGGFGIRMIWQLYSQAREIFLVRDFRDMACSIFAFNKKSGRTGFGIEKADSDREFVSILQRKYRGLFDNWIQRRDKAFLVRYEDLVREPEATLAAVLEYVGIDTASATIQGTVQRARELSPERQQQHITAKSPAESIGRWRRDLDPTLRAVCDEGIEDVLEAFGYSPSSQQVGA